MAPSPRELVDDAISEILLRLPPDEPQWLFRAALVCKPWLRTLTDAAFLRRYRDFHGSPPLLGLIGVDEGVEAGQAPHFVPTTAVPASPIPPSDDPYAFTSPIDCRHGLVLLSKIGDERRNYLNHYLVCDPITGDRHRVPHPHPKIPIVWTWGAVFCAAAGCGHLDCHGGPFCVVRLFSYYTSPTIFTMSAVMYSSEIGAWRDPATLDFVLDEPYGHGPLFEGDPLVEVGPYGRGPLIGDEIYFAIRGEAHTIVKYDWANNSLSAVKPQPPAMHGGFVLLVTEDRSLGLAGIEDSRLHLWSRSVSSDGTAEWVQCRVIDLEKMMPMANPSDRASVVGFAEGVGVIFVSTRVGLFMMELKSGRVRKVDNFQYFSSILPYMSFYTPGRGRFLQLAKSH